MVQRLYEGRYPEYARPNSCAPQPERHAASVITCRCGGHIELYAQELGTCHRCKHDFHVDTFKGHKRIRQLVDHRRDLV